jgi:hypothetical protein
MADVIGQGRKNRSVYTVVEGSSARTGVGAALDSDSAALATSSMMLLPTSNMISRSEGPPQCRTEDCQPK